MQQFLAGNNSVMVMINMYHVEFELVCTCIKYKISETAIKKHPYGFKIHAYNCNEQFSVLLQQFYILSTMYSRNQRATFKRILGFCKWAF